MFIYCRACLWFLLCVNFFNFVNADKVTANFNITRTENGCVCLSGENSITVSSGQDVEMKFAGGSFSDTGLLHNSTCLLKGNDTRDFLNKEAPNTLIALVENVTKEFRSEWKCEIETIGYCKPEPTCKLDVIINPVVVTFYVNKTDCSSHQSSLSVFTGQDVQLKFNVLGNLKKSQIRCNVTTDRIEMTPPDFTSMYTVQNITKEYESVWNCIVKDAQYDNETICKIKVIVTDPPTVSASLNSDAEPSKPWMVIGIVIGVLVILIIIGQTACICYFRRKAQLIRRRERLSTKASDSSENLDNNRYSFLPLRKKNKEPTTEESTYETVGHRAHLLPSRDVCMSPIRPPMPLPHEENVCMSPILKRQPIAPPKEEEAPSSTRPRPPSLSSLPRKGKRKLSVPLKNTNPSSEPMTSSLGRRKVPSPIPHTSIGKEKRKLSVPLKNTNPSSEPMTSSLERRKVPPPTPLTSIEKTKISQKLEDIFKRKECEGKQKTLVPAKPQIDTETYVNDCPAVSKPKARPSPLPKPKPTRNTTANEFPSNSPVEVLHTKSKSFSTTPNSMTSPILGPSNRKPIEPTLGTSNTNTPPRRFVPPLLVNAVPANEIRRAVMPPRDISPETNEGLETAPNRYIPPNPQVPSQPEPIQEESYEAISEFDSESDEDWTYEPLSKEHLYNI